jgi:hypothetical protein
MDRRADADLHKILSIVRVKWAIHEVYTGYGVVVLMGACNDSKIGSNRTL